MAALRGNTTSGTQPVATAMLANDGTKTVHGSRGRRRDLNVRLMLRVLADEIRLQNELCAKKEGRGR